MANTGFAHVLDGRPISVTFLSSMQGKLREGTPLAEESGRVGAPQVVIGRRIDAPVGAFPVHAARFVPSPPGMDLETRLRDLADWMQADHNGVIDPVFDFAIANPTFTVKKAVSALGLSYQRVNRLIGRLVELGVLRQVPTQTYGRRFFAPRVLKPFVEE